MSTQKLVRLALLTAAALALHLAEAQLPPLIPIPGVKLGLANLVSLWALAAWGPGEAALILLARVLLGGLFAGQLLTLLYSLSGGLLCLLAMVLLRRAAAPGQLWVVSVGGALAHNLGQLTAAVLVTRTPALLLYLPILLASGVVTGLFIGLTTQLLRTKLPRV